MASTSVEPVHAAHFATERSAAVTTITAGHFTAARAPGEYVLAYPDSIELRQMSAKGTSTTVCRTQLYAHVRGCAAVPSSDPDVTDALAVTADNGRVILLRFDRGSNDWTRESFATFGRSGVRRAIPGHYLAVDPKGRALMVAGFERSKLVFPIRNLTQKKVSAGGDGSDNDHDDDSADGSQSDSDDFWKGGDEEGPKLKLGSALEANQASSFVFSCIGLDSRSDSPQFACLEHQRDQMAPGEKAAVVYEHDTSLNTIVRLWVYPVAPTSSMLIGFPQSNMMPTGAVVACAEDTLIGLSYDGHRVRRCETSLPRRTDYPFTQGAVMSVAATFVKVRDGRVLLVLQNELGDLFKVDMQPKVGDVTDLITARYIDTVPVCSAMHLFRHGYLYTACEAADHMSLRVKSDGPKDDGYLVARKRYSFQDTGVTIEIGTFDRHERLMNLEKVDSVAADAPVIASVPMPIALRKSSSDAVMLIGRGNTSTVAVRRYGHEATSSAQVALPAGGFHKLIPIAADVTDGDAWAAERHTRIVATSAAGTMVFAMEDSSPNGFAPLTSSGFATAERTLAAAALVQGAGTLQIHNRGLRHVTATESFDWKHGFGKTVVAAAATSSEAVLAFQHGGLYRFDLDAGTKKFVAGCTVDDTSSEALCVAIAPPTSAGAHADLVGVGFPGSFVTMRARGEGALTRNIKKVTCPADPTSAAFVTMPDNQLYAFVGLANGTLVRVTVDASTGVMLAVDETVLGSGECSVVCPSGAQLAPHVLVTCDGALYKASMIDGGHHIAPVRPHNDAGIRAVEAVCDVSSGKFPTGHVAVVHSGNLISFARVGSSVSHVHRLPAPSGQGLTARKIVLHPAEPLAFVLFASTRSAHVPRSKASDTCGSPTGDVDQHLWRLAVYDLVTFAIRTSFDPISERLITTSANEAAVSLGLFTPPEARGAPVIVVGAVPNLRVIGNAIDPNNLPLIRCFSLDNGQLRHQHSTTVDAIPYAFTALHQHGLLASGIGTSVRCFSMGQRQLLRKCQVRSIVPNGAAVLESDGSMIAVGDFHESVKVLKFYPAPRTGMATTAGAVIVAVADDYVQRHVVAACFVDQQTVAATDRFGNVVVLRVPGAASVTANAAAAELQGPVAPTDEAETITKPAAKLVATNQMHVGSTATSIAVVRQREGAVLAYGCIDGQAGVLIPVMPREYEHLHDIESAVRVEAIPLVGREHERFRSTYGPCRSIVDCDYSLFQFDRFDGETRDMLEETVKGKALQRAAMDATAEGTPLTDEVLADAKVPGPAEAILAVKAKLRDA